MAKIKFNEQVRKDKEYAKIAKKIRNSVYRKDILVIAKSFFAKHSISYHQQFLIMSYIRTAISLDMKSICDIHKTSYYHFAIKLLDLFYIVSYHEDTSFIYHIKRVLYKKHKLNKNEIELIDAMVATTIESEYISLFN